MEIENYFEKDIIPANETERLTSLRYFDILSELPDEYFNTLARTIAMTFSAPIGLVTMVADEDVYFRGNMGMEGISKVPRGKSLCSLAILDTEPTVFENALAEPCLIRNPLVHGEFGLRFYAGAPIVTKEGYCLGSVCIVDKNPRQFPEEDRRLLSQFAEVAMNQLYLNYQHRVHTTESDSLLNEHNV